MKVLHIIDNLNQGGEQRQLLEFVRRLDPSQIETWLLTYDWAPFFLSDFRSAGVRLVHIEKGLGPRPRFLRRLRSFIKARDFNIVHAHLPGPSSWACLATRPRGNAGLVLQEATVDVAPAWKIVAAKRLLFPLADRIIANTHAQSRVLTERYKIPTEKVKVIPNGLDLDEHPVPSDEERRRARVLFDIPEAGFVVGTAGRIYDIKNPGLLLDAVIELGRRGLPTPVVLHAGAATSTALKSDLERKIRNEGVAWRWLGEVRDMSQFYASLDSFALTSICEGLPNVVLEAFAAALPVLGTRVGDMERLVISGETGHLFESGSVQGLVSGLEHLMSLSGNQLRSLGMNGRRIVANYSTDAMVESTLEVYSSAFLRS